jgi:hypothetical protein
MIYERLFEHIKFARPWEFAAVHQAFDNVLRDQGAIVACAIHNNVDLSLYCCTESTLRCHIDKTPLQLGHSSHSTPKIDLAQTRARSLIYVAF